MVLIYSPPLPLTIRILLVEDHEINRRLLQDYLLFRGYEVFGIADGADFFTAMGEYCPDLILLDLKLPNLDGFTILEQLRTHIELPQVPVIVISAYAFESDQQRALELGATHYLVKPIRLDSLRQLIETTIANQGKN